jgi:lipopolysaccharide assembly protein A
VRLLKWAFVILAGFLVIIVIAQNIANLETPVVFRMNLWLIEPYQSPNIPVGFLAFITFALGVLFMLLCGIKERFGFKKQIRQLQSELRAKEKELSTLRTMPVRNEVYDLEPISDAERK